MNSPYDVPWYTLGAYIQGGTMQTSAAGKDINQYYKGWQNYVVKRP